MTGYLHDVNRPIGIDLDNLPAVKHALRLGRPPRVAFSGTRQGMFLRQKQFTAALIEHLKPARFDHGAAVGADAEAHAMIVQTICEEVHLWWGNILKFQMKPGYDAKEQVPKGNVGFLIHHPPAPPMDRNWDILTDKDILIACPATTQMELRSGTWATVRGADQLGIKTLVISPIPTDET